MEEDDPDMEWEIQEYPSSKEDADQYSKVRWILNKGLCFGKKAVIAGIAMSSAPLVLPPLVVFSTLGFAFSVPFGFVFASYACTDKLMSKLLPTPSPSSDLEYYSDEEKEEHDYKRETVMEEEENEQMEDIKQGIGMRIELDGGYGGKELVGNNYVQEPITYLEEYVDGYGEKEEDGDNYEQEPITYLDGYGEKEEVPYNYEQEPITYLEENVDEKGNEEDDGENGGKTDSIVGENVGVEKLIGDIKVKDERGREVRIQGKNERIREETEKPFQEKDVKLEKFIVRMKEANGDKREGAGVEENKMPDKVKQVVEAVDRPTENDNAKNAHNIGEPHGFGNDVSLGRNEDRVVKEQNTPVIQKDVVMQKGKAKDNAMTDHEHENTISKRDKGNVIHSNADAREIADESGFDLFDDRNAASVQNNCTVHESLEGNDNVNFIFAEETVDILALPANSARIDGSNYVKIASETDTKVPSSEAFSDEEKIWEQIGAIRAIVGYKAAAQPTCIGELKALYVLTGVEPPASFKDSSDLAEVNDKLRFLMSIVGVK